MESAHEISIITVGEASRTVIQRILHETQASHRIIKREDNIHAPDVWELIPAETIDAMAQQLTPQVRGAAVLAIALTDDPTAEDFHQGMLAAVAFREIFGKQDVEHTIFYFDPATEKIVEANE